MRPAGQFFFGDASLLGVLSHQVISGLFFKV